MHPLLAEFVQAWKQETPYGQPGDWVFPSFKLKGKRPRSGSMLSKSYLRPAAVKARVALQEGQRFGFHNLRHSLATFLVNTKTDVTTVQSILRHANSQMTLNCYSHAKDNSKLAAQGEMLAAIFPQQDGASLN
jgi:integrase